MRGQVGAYGAIKYDLDNPPPLRKSVCPECPWRYAPRDTIDGGKVMLIASAVKQCTETTNRSACHMTQSYNGENGPKVQMCRGQEVFRANLGLLSPAEKNPAIYRSIEDVRKSPRADWWAKG